MACDRTFSSVRAAQLRVIYDLNAPGVLVLDPGALVQELVDCSSPNFLVFSDHGIGNAYFKNLLIRGVEVVSENEHFIILRNPAAASGGSRRRARCSGGYPMTG